MRIRLFTLNLVLVLPLLVACGDDDTTPTQSIQPSAGNGGTGGSAGSAGSAGTAGSAGSGGAAATAGSAGTAGSGGGTITPAFSKKIDMLVVVDNSASMADKQQVLSKTLARSVGRLINPLCVTLDGNNKPTPVPDQPGDPLAPCPGDSKREFAPIADLHLGVVTSSLGGHGSDYCTDIDPGAPNQDSRKNFTQNDRGRLISRGPRPAGSTTVDFDASVKTYKDAGFFAWDPGQKSSPPGESDQAKLIDGFSKVVLGADQIGCGYEATLEAWYRFLIDPLPPATVAPNPAGPSNTPIVDGVDSVLLSQRAEFLRPDSLVVVVNLSDENDCSIIDGVLPADVCDEPTLDGNGNPTGCKGERVGWPTGYAEGNFFGWKSSGGRVTGTPFPANHLAALQRINNTPFHLSSGTPECADDPYSPACTNCYTGATGCQAKDDNTDAPNLRCWDQKRRFGTSFLYPLKRYSDGLSQAKVYDRDGFLVANPLYKGGRSPSLVFYMPVIGVPWQDLARDPGDLTKGYRPAAGGQEPGVDWDLILGNPFALDKAQRKGPTDPLMDETNQPRLGSHPITKELIGAGKGWNSLNGHEWSAGTTDLQFACIFQLSQPRDCANATSSCDCSAKEGETVSNPLCEKPDASGKGDGVATTTQYFAKAYPGTRFLQVARDLGANSVVASICTPNVDDPSRGDFGYNAAFASLIERIGPQIAP